MEARKDLNLLNEIDYFLYKMSDVDLLNFFPFKISYVKLLNAIKAYYIIMFVCKMIVV